MKLENNRRLYLKGRFYYSKEDKLIVICSKTADNYSESHFIGIVVSGDGVVPGNSMKCSVDEGWEEIENLTIRTN